MIELSKEMNNFMSFPFDIGDGGTTTEKKQ